MGTIINGKKIENFCIAGNKLNGFAKNGNIVFKKEESGDKTPPKITVKTGINETIGDAINGYTKISFKIFDNVALMEYDINGVVSKVSQSQWGDINNIAIGVKGVIIGNNILRVRDTAKNEAIKEFKIIEI